MPIYLGLDSSTQSLTAVAIEVDGDRRQVVAERSLRFDEDLPRYGTRNGVLPSDDPLVARSSPRMWAEALDRMLALLAEDGAFPLSELRAIAGSGQQHGSVYLSPEAEEILTRLDPAQPFVEQLADLYARQNAPIWMDSSTTQQCEDITRAIGGEGVLANLTGSRAFERFTGPQIRKYYEEDPDGYDATGRIHLVSSYMATLLAGRHASIDPGDASGMNLMELAHKRWAASALQVTAPNLGDRLPEIRESWTEIGPIGPYWRSRYGYPDGVRVISWSGDNPCSLIGVGLIESGRIAISLGTSDTLFGFMPLPRVDPMGGGHAFGAPTGDYMSLICFKNGSLARERIRERHGLDWDGFSAALASSAPGNGGGILMPWFEAEITPTVLEPGVRRYGLDEGDAARNVRAVVEAQMMSMAIHSRWMGVDVTTIHATGGAARNREILQVMADIHDAEVYQFEVGNSAALGAALRAFHADRMAEGDEIPWTEVVRGFAEPVIDSRIAPDPDRVALYRDLMEVYEAGEAHALRGGDDPAPLIEAFRAKHPG